MCAVISKRSRSYNQKHSTHAVLCVLCEKHITLITPYALHRIVSIGTGAWPVIYDDIPYGWERDILRQALRTVFYLNPVSCCGSH